MIDFRRLSPLHPSALEVRAHFVHITPDVADANSSSVIKSQKALHSVAVDSFIMVTTFGLKETCESDIFCLD